MKARTGFVVASFLAIAGMACGQVHQVALDTFDTDTEGARPTDAALGVNDDDTIVVMTNMRVRLFSKSGGSPLDDWQVGDTTNFPFRMFGVADGRFFDPRVEYDPINDRLWMMYSEDDAPTPGTRARVHVAVSKENEPVDDFSGDNWWYFTGKAGGMSPTVRDGEPFDMGDTDLRRYLGTTDPDLHQPFQTLVDLPSVAFDERAMILSPYSKWAPLNPLVDPDVISNSLIIIPFEHNSGADSILDGDRPDESDITHIRLSDLDEQGGEEDLARRYYAVQEPYEQVENATFFITVPSEDRAVSGKYSGIRLTGLYFDENIGSDGDWVVQQYVVSSTLTDMGLPSSSFEYHISNGIPLVQPETPLSWKPAAFAWHFSQSATLVRESSNSDPRIFAAHAVFDDDGGSADPQWIIQWYIINPDLSDFRTSSWAPSIVTAGRIDHSGTGDHYHPVIGVTRQGVAYIEYTYSDGSDWPQIRRAQLSNTYTSVVGDTLVQADPEMDYTGSSWCDYAEMQPDPTDCTLWSVHTLVYDDPDPVSNPDRTDGRSVWLFELDGGCNNANLNFDPYVDAYDLALFNSFYNAGARRVDMNTDGTTDATDAAIYADAYDAATRP